MAWTALGLVGLVGMAALSIDMGYMYVLKSQLQTTADAAASAAARELPNSTSAQNAALALVTANMPTAAHGNVVTTSDIEIGNWNTGTKAFTVGGSPTNAVRVNAHRDPANANAAKTFFATILGIEEVALNASAIAVQGSTSGGPPCVLALDPSSNSAFNMNSNANINLTGCGVYVNSTNSSALSLSANAQMAAASICVTGGFDDGVNTSVSPTPMTGSTNCPQIADPLYGIFHSPSGSEPTPGACIAARTNRNFGVDDPPTISPGTYCGGIRIGFTGGGNPDSGCAPGSGGPVVKTMLPGIYILRDSPVGAPLTCGGTVAAGTRRAGLFEMASNTVISGNGVFIFLTGATNVNSTNPVMSLDSNSQLNLVAMSSGPYEGVVIYQDDDLVGLTNRLHSNTNKRYVGAVYFPNGDVLADSNGSINFNSACSLFIARRFQFDSNAGLTGNINLETGCTAAIANLLQGVGTIPGTTTTLVR